MRKYYYVLTILIFTISGLQSSAQNVLTGQQAKQWYSNAEMVRTSQYGNLPSYVKYRVGDQPNTATYIQNLARTLKLQSNLQLVLDSQDDDKLGFVHYRFHQEYNGVPVEFTAWIVHSKNGLVVSANGFIHQSLPTPTAASISASQAIQYATNYIGATTYKWQLAGEEAHLKLEQNDAEATYYPSPKLVYSPKGHDYSGDMFRLAYKMNIYAQEPLSRQSIYVDAVTGEILNSIEQIHVADVQGTATTGYSGAQTITTDQVSMTNYRLRETGRGNGVETYDMQQGTSYGSAVDFTDTDNNWNNINAQFDQFATDAHWGSEMTYDYLLNEHGRNSIDNNGFKLRAYIHFDQNYNNAFWDGSRMTYGDGNGNPLTSIDIAGHEIAHGLTSNTANLIYNAESGALNESFSDIFGTAIERYGRPSNWDWLMGEDLGTAFRSMSDPNSKGDPDTYFGNNWASLSGGDAGGVHTNSSVQNYWFYLLSVGGNGTNDNGDSYNLTGIGFSDAEDVAFRNLTVYLTQSSNFADARFFSIQAAIDLYGPCTPKVGQVTDAWYAVGVGTNYVPYTVADFESQITSSCSAPFTVSFSNLSVNGVTYTWNFGDGTTSTQVNPTHTYTTMGAYTVTLQANGGAICGVADTVKTNYINIDSSLPCIVSLPANGVGNTQTSCSGFLYDSGGPNGNYGSGESSQITIAPPGASSLNLYIHQFSIEAGTGSSCNYDDLIIYDGTNTSGNVIGTYCNNNVLTNFTSSTGAITIAFNSDGGVEESGFEIEWVCNSPNTAPVVRFKHNILNTCTGNVTFTDESNNNPTSWSWDFGDGQTSTQQHPTHHYNASGTYSVELTATNAFGSGSKTHSNIIQVNLKTPPNTINDTACTGMADTLIAISSGEHYWYDDAFGGTSIFTGDTFITPGLSATTNYYVEQEVGSATSSVGPADNNIGGGGFFNGDHFLIFTVTNPMILKSVYVYANTPGPRTVTLYDNTNTILDSKTVNLTAGGQRINLDFNIQPGTGYKIGFPTGSSPDLYRNNSGVSFPYTNSLMSITGTTANGAQYYYFFYDWFVQAPVCTSPRVTVVAEVETCEANGINDPSLNLSVSVFPNPADNEVNIEIAEFNSSSPTQINVLNSLGQVVITHPVSNTISKLDVSHLAKGVYYIQIEMGNSTQVEKLVIQ